MKLTSVTALAVMLITVQSAAAQQISFVTCPIVRDTRTVPCFLAEYQGEIYYLAVQQDISADQYPPQLLHEVLVEGTVEKGPRVCGGIPLKPVKPRRRSVTPAAIQIRVPAGNPIIKANPRSQHAV